MVKEKLNEMREGAKEVTSGIEESIDRRFPWIKATFGGLWTIVWIIIAFTIEALFILVPILFIIAGLVFLFILLAPLAETGIFDIFLWSSGSSSSDKSKKKENR